MSNIWTVRYIKSMWAGLIILMLESLRQENLEFETSLGYVARSSP